MTAERFNPVSWSSPSGAGGTLLSIVVPAYNEERELPSCLESIHSACATAFTPAEGEPLLRYELIVANNNSTDATARLARRHGARVVFEPINQISRARNRGASIARGHWLLFVDADSRLHWATLGELQVAIQSDRYVGGGCTIGLDSAPWWGSASVQLWNLAARCMRLASGSFLFCRRDAFKGVRGFSENLYASEDLAFSLRLKQWGRSRGLAFCMLSAQPHISSGRKFHLYSRGEIAAHFFRSLALMPYTARRRAQLDYFYDGRRQNAVDRTVTSECSANESPIRLPPSERPFRRDD